MDEVEIRPYVRKAKRLAAAAEDQSAPPPAGGEASAAQASETAQSSSSSSSAPRAPPSGASSSSAYHASATRASYQRLDSGSGSSASEAANAPVPSERLAGTVLDIRNKLSGMKDKQRDPKLLAQVKQPVYLSHHVARGISPEQAKAALAQHTKHLIGLQYHLAKKGEELRKKQKGREPDRPAGGKR